MGIPWSFAFVMSSTSDVCMLNLLRSHVEFHMACVILMLATSREFRLMLLSLSPNGLLTYKRMVIRCSKSQREKSSNGEPSASAV
jgi:hypothetical protein